jgi:hypothetical protein
VAAEKRYTDKMNDPRGKYPVSTIRLVIMLLAAACAHAPGPAAPTATPMPPMPTPTQAGPIARERAVEVAIQACDVPHMVLNGAPHNIRAKLTTLDQAADGGSTRYDQPLSTTVWLVQMDGQLQLVGGVLPTPGGPGATPPQPFEGTCTVLIDANTGDWFEKRGQPLVSAP